MCSVSIYACMHIHVSALFVCACVCVRVCVGGFNAGPSVALEVLRLDRDAPRGRDLLKTTNHKRAKRKYLSLITILQRRRGTFPIQTSHHRPHHRTPDLESYYCSQHHNSLPHNTGFSGS